MFQLHQLKIDSMTEITEPTYADGTYLPGLTTESPNWEIFKALAEKEGDNLTGFEIDFDGYISNKVWVRDALDTPHWDRLVHISGMDTPNFMVDQVTSKVTRWCDADGVWRLLLDAVRSAVELTVVARETSQHMIQDCDMLTCGDLVAAMLGRMVSIPALRFEDGDDFIGRLVAVGPGRLDVHPDGCGVMTLRGLPDDLLAYAY